MTVVSVIMIFVALLIGVSLLPTFADEVWGAQYGENTSFPTNVTGATATITALLTLFFAIVILMAMVRWGIARK